MTPCGDPVQAQRHNRGRDGGPDRGFGGGVTLYDMCKAVDRMVIESVCLLEKQGGRSGHSRVTNRKNIDGPGAFCCSAERAGRDAIQVDLPEGVSTAAQLVDWRRQPMWLSQGSGGDTATDGGHQ